MSTRYIVLAFVLFGSANSWAATIDVAFDSLPSAQGWEYQGQVPETSAFSVDGTTLTLDTLGQGDVHSIYFMRDILDPALPFTILIRARVLQQDAPESPPFGISAFTGQENFQVALGVDRLRVNGEYFVLDGTQFHDFRFEVVPGVGSSVSVDGNLLSSFAPVPSPVVSQILFGDGSSFPNSNSLVQIQRLTIQPQTLLSTQMRALITQVEALAEEGLLRVSQMNRLARKLEAAGAHLSRGNNRSACNGLREFIIQVTSFIDAGTLPSNEGNELIGAANEIKVDVCGFTGDGIADLDLVRFTATAGVNKTQQCVAIVATIRNQGTILATKIKVELEVIRVTNRENRRRIGMIDFLEAHTTTTLHVPTLNSRLCIPPGPIVIRVTVDPFDKILEVDETNNVSEVVLQSPGD